MKIFSLYSFRTLRMHSNDTHMFNSTLPFCMPTACPGGGDLRRRQHIVARYGGDGGVASQAGRLGNTVL